MAQYQPLHTPSASDAASGPSGDAAPSAAVVGAGGLSGRYAGSDLDAHHPPGRFGERSSAFHAYARAVLDCTCCLDVWARIEPVAPTRAQVIGYLSGTLFAVGWWLFFDGVAFSASHGLPVPIRPEDWLPGVFSTLSLILVNLISKDHINATEFTYGDDHVATKARACAFLGAVMALSSLGGSIAIMVFKYILPGYHGNDFWFAICLVAQNALIFVSSMVLWFGRNVESDDSNGLTLY